MAANLDIVNGKASMFYAQDSGVPWHKEGTSVATAVNSKEAAKLAGIDWKVETQEICLTGSASRKPIETHKAVMRMTDFKVLGIVGKDYQPIQNADGFAFLDSLVEDRELLYDTAGALNGGRTTWMLARIPSDVTVQDDTFARYLLAATSHDASRALQIWTTQVRVVCANTLAVASSAKAAVSIRHSGDIQSKLAASSQLLKVTYAEHERMTAWLDKLSRVAIEQPQVNAVQEALFGPLDDSTPTQRKNAIADFLAVYNEESERVGDNAYALANAVTGYADHKLRVNNDSSRLASILSGRGAQVTQTGLNAVAKVAAVAR